MIATHIANPDARIEQVTGMMISAEPGDRVEAVDVAKLQLLASHTGMRLILHGTTCLNTAPTTGSGVKRAYLAHDRA